MFWAIGHADAVLVAEHRVHLHQMIQRLPAFRRIDFSSGNKKRARSQQRVKFVEIAILFKKPLAYVVLT